MKKNKFLFISSLIAFTFILLLQALPYAKCQTTLTDNQDDVIKMNGLLPADKGNYLDEIDIIQLDIDGQKFNLTLGGDLEAITYNYSWIDCAIYIFETYNTSLDLYDQLQYSIVYYPYTNYEILLRKHVSSNGGYSHYYWNGVGFYSNGDMVIGNIDSNLISAEVPIDALQIFDNFTFIVETFYGNWLQNATWYYDIIPNQYARYKVTTNGGIPGYNILILLSGLFSLTLVSLKKKSNAK